MGLTVSVPNVALQGFEGWKGLVAASYFAHASVCKDVVARDFQHLGTDDSLTHDCVLRRTHSAVIVCF